jgi:hypothetical protein
MRFFIGLMFYDEHTYIKVQNRYILLKWNVYIGYTDIYTLDYTYITAYNCHLSWIDMCTLDK